MTSPETIETLLADEGAQVAFGERLGQALAAGLGALARQGRAAPLAVYLKGDLGTGKTTLVRGILAGLGHRGPVRSPTYTLIEPYELEGRCVYHLDLYRLGDPEELDYLGLRDLVGEAALLLVEWPERGAGALPQPDLAIGLDYLPQGRGLSLCASSPAGRVALAWLAPAPAGGLEGEGQRS
jgi:tRNA threonylcarbamoyladenosine biosynthesis protein TsaE